MYLSCNIPVLNPNLYIRNEYETKVAKNSSFELRWEACYIYKSDNNSDKEL
jgi:hypothetical protein